MILLNVIYQSSFKRIIYTLTKRNEKYNFLINVLFVLKLKLQ